MAKLKPEEAKALQDEAVSEALHEARLERCIPVARKILEVLTQKLPYLGDVIDPKTGQAKPEANESYNEIAGVILEDMLKADLKFTDKLFVFSLAKQALGLAEEKVQNSLDRSMEKAEANLWGVDSIMDVTLKQVDDQLKS